MHILVFFIILTVLVFVHEWGHYSMAKKAGMKVEEFGIGIPPRVFGKKYGDTLWSINAFPIGGFVKVKGLDTQEGVINTDADSYHAKTWWQKLRFILAGPIMNFFLTILLLSIGYMVGMKPLWGTQLYKDSVRMEGLYISEVMPEGTAYGNLQTGDTILSINDIEVVNSEEFIHMLQQAQSREVALKVERNGEEKNLIVPVDTSGKIGVAFQEKLFVEELHLMPWEALYIGTYQTFELSVLTVQSIFDMFRDRSMENISGPVGIVKMTGDVVKYGFIAIMQFAAILSLSLGILNLFPFPALDGGRAFILIIEGIVGKKLPPKIETIIHTVGFTLLMILILYVTIGDVRKLF